MCCNKVIYWPKQKKSRSIPLNVGGFTKRQKILNCMQISGSKCFCKQKTVNDKCSAGELHLSRSSIRTLIQTNSGTKRNMKHELEIGLKTVQNRLNENTKSPSENQNRSKIESILHTKKSIKSLPLLKYVKLLRRDGEQIFSL